MSDPNDDLLDDESFVDGTFDIDGADEDALLADDWEESRTVRHNQKEDPAEMVEEDVLEIKAYDEDLSLKDDDKSYDDPSETSSRGKSAIDNSDDEEVSKRHRERFQSERSNLSNRSLSAIPDSLDNVITKGQSSVRGRHAGKSVRGRLGPLLGRVPVQSRIGSHGGRGPVPPLLPPRMLVPSLNGPRPNQGPLASPPPPRAPVKIHVNPHFRPRLVSPQGSLGPPWEGNSIAPNQYPSQNNYQFQQSQQSPLPPQAPQPYNQPPHNNWDPPPPQPQFFSQQNNYFGGPPQANGFYGSGPSPGGQPPGPYPPQGHIPPGPGLHPPPPPPHQPNHPQPNWDPGYYPSPPHPHHGPRIHPPPPPHQQFGHPNMPQGPPGNMIRFNRPAHPGHRGPPGHMNRPGVLRPGRPQGPQMFHPPRPAPLRLSLKRDLPNRAGGGGGGGPTTPPKQPRPDLKVTALNRNLHPVATVEKLPQAPVEEDDEEMKEYKRKIEEQKRLREEFLRKKEEKRRQEAAQHRQQMQSAAKNKLGIKKHEPETDENDSSELPLEQQFKVVRVKTKDGQIVTKKLSLARIQKMRKLNPSEANVTEPPKIDTDTVLVENLSACTTKKQLLTMAKQVGVVQSVDLNLESSRATIKFNSNDSASEFVNKFQRKMVDLSMISVSLVPPQ